MARIRAIKPEFWSSPGVAALDPWGRLLFIAMWNWADDDGVGTANLRELAGFAFPNDEDIDVGAMRRLCADLSAHVGVIFYEVHGRPYYCIPTWDRHQKIDRRRTGRHPKPAEAEKWLHGTADQHKHPTPDTIGAESAQDRRTVGATQAPEQGNRGTGEQGNRGTSLTSPSTSPDVTRANANDDEDPFEQLWNQWPRFRRREKAKARAAWLNATRTTPPAVILDGLTRYADACTNGWEDPQYVPHPHKWLTTEGWANEYGPRPPVLTHAQQANRDINRRLEEIAREDTPA